MKKILVVCGATSTGKTSLATKLAKKFNGEIVSADSRQVYKKLNIGTGKDLPKNAVYKKGNKKTGDYYQIDNLKIWCYDLVSPKDEFSVAQYTSFAREAIKDIHKRKKLPILVGGTGFYIKAVVYGIDTVSVPKNVALRKNLKIKTADELFNNLAFLDPTKAGSLNQSDKKNPRRLMRAIEIATWKLKNAGIKMVDETVNFNLLFIGLHMPKKTLFKRIEKRVLDRVPGVKKEIVNLLKEGVEWSDQSMSSLGYKQWKEYFEGQENEKEVIKKWFSEEKRYSRRQSTWFKKQKNINWLDVSKAKSYQDIEKMVKKWYSSN